MEKPNRLNRVVKLVKSRYGCKNQKEIAAKLDIGYSYLSAILNGKVQLSEKTLEKFEDTFAVNPAFVTGESNEPWSDGHCDVIEEEQKEMSYEDRVSALVQALKGRYGYTLDREICSQVGLGYTYFSDLKKGKSVMRGVVKYALSARFGVNPDYLDGNSDEIFSEGHTNIMHGNNNMNVQGNRNNVNGCDSGLVKSLMEENENLKKQLAETNVQLSNAQRHIDKLIAIIDSGKKEARHE